MDDKVTNVTLNAIVSVVLDRDFVKNELVKYRENEDEFLIRIKERLYELCVAFDEDDEFIKKAMKEGEIDNPDWDAIIEVCHAFLRPKIIRGYMNHQRIGA